MSHNSNNPTLNSGAMPTQSQLSLEDLLSLLAGTPTAPEDLSVLPLECHLSNTGSNTSLPHYADPNASSLHAGGPTQAQFIASTPVVFPSEPPAWTGRRLVLPRLGFFFEYIFATTGFADVGFSSVPHDSEITPIVCLWQGCTYTGYFQRQAELLRHVKHVHIYRRSFPCPVEGCSSCFNRRDNLQVHLNRTHGGAVRLRGAR
jgi:hypothetical protein